MANADEMGNAHLVPLSQILGRRGARARDAALASYRGGCVARRSLLTSIFPRTTLRNSLGRPEVFLSAITARPTILSDVRVVPLRRHVASNQALEK